MLFTIGAVASEGGIGIEASNKISSSSSVSQSLSDEEQDEALDLGTYARSPISLQSESESSSSLLDDGNVNRLFMDEDDCCPSILMSTSFSPAVALCLPDAVGSNWEG